MDDFVGQTLGQFARPLACNRSQLTCGVTRQPLREDPPVVASDLDRGVGVEFAVDFPDPRGEQRLAAVNQRARGAICRPGTNTSNTPRERPATSASIGVKTM